MFTERTSQMIVGVAIGTMLIFGLVWLMLYFE